MSDELAKVVFRASRRDPEGVEETSEREVACASREELYRTLCLPWDALPEAPDPAAGERWQDTVTALESWLSNMRLELAERTDREGGRVWSFRFRGSGGAEEGPSVEVPDPEGHGGDAGRDAPGTPGLVVSGDLEASLHTDRSGRNLSLGDDRSGIQVQNTGLMVWNRDNVYALIRMAVNVTVNMPGSAPAQGSA